MCDRIKNGNIWLYAVFHEKSSEMSVLDKYLDLLPPERREKALRYHHPIDRHHCILSYLLLRYALNSRFGLHNPRIAVTERGKPFLPDYPEVYFNLSHCPKGCVVGVSDVPIGVDVQDVRAFSPRLVQFCCSPEEKARIAQATQPEAEFTKIWAMKESYLKCKGCGIIRDLPSVDTTQLETQIAVYRQHDCYIAVACEPR